jgi:hypothetical protein
VFAGGLLSIPTPALLPGIVAQRGTDAALDSARETWAYIERLLVDECGLQLSGQRFNCINAIKNGISRGTTHDGTRATAQSGDDPRGWLEQGRRCVG